MEKQETFHKSKKKIKNQINQYRKISALFIFTNCSKVDSVHFFGCYLNLWEFNDVTFLSGLFFVFPESLKAA